MGQAVDEMNRLGPVVTEDQSASLSASVRVRYGRLTEVSTCVQVHDQVTNIEPCGVGCVTDDAISGPIVSGTVLRLLGIQALTRTATIEVSYDT